MSNEIHGNDFDEAIDSMLSDQEKDSQRRGGQYCSTPASQNRSRSISRLSDDSRLLTPTVASANNIYQKSPGPIWEPPAHIISAPSAKLRRTTKATEAQKYDEHRRNVTPKRESGYRKYLNSSEAQNLLHTDADTLYSSNSKRGTRSTSRPKSGDGGNSSSGTRRPSSAKRRDEESVVHRQTASSVHHQYKKEKEESVIWQKPARIREPSVQLTKSTPGIDAHKVHPVYKRPKTPDQKRENSWTKPYQVHSHSILDLAHLSAKEQLFQRKQRRDKSTDRSTRSVYTSDRFEALTSPNAARKADANALRKMREDKIPKPIKKPALLTNQRLIQPTLANLYSTDEIEFLRNSVRAADDPFWDKRQGKELPNRSPTVEKKLASTPSKLMEPTFATMYGSKRKYVPPPPTMRSKSPTPTIKPPSEHLLQETEAGVSRIKAGIEVRSSSARRATGGSSVYSSRSISTTVSESLLQPTSSFTNSTWKARTPSPGARMRSRSAGSSRDVISPDLIERLERKTASIVYKQWTGSERELKEFLYIQKARRGKACGERAVSEGIPPSLLRDTASISTFRRGKYENKGKEKDLLDIGEGWYEKHHVPTEAEIRAGNHLHNHIGELTSLNYDKYQPLNSKENNSGGVSSRNSTPNKKPQGKENTNTRQSPNNVEANNHDDSDNFQELNADANDSLDINNNNQSPSTPTKSSGRGNVKMVKASSDDMYGSMPSNEVSSSTNTTRDGVDDVGNNSLDGIDNTNNASRKSSGDHSDNSIAIA